ncbi:MAG: hypothetical protein ACYCPS_06090 [Candidatus Saccharimonadales bacterium]
MLQLVFCINFTTGDSIQLDVKGESGGKWTVSAAEGISKRGFMRGMPDLFTKTKQRLERPDLEEADAVVALVEECVKIIGEREKQHGKEFPLSSVKVTLWEDMEFWGFDEENEHTVPGRRIMQTIVGVASNKTLSDRLSSGVGAIRKWFDSRGTSISWPEF